MAKPERDIRPKSGSAEAQTEESLFLIPFPESSSGRALDLAVHQFQDGLSQSSAVAERYRKALEKIIDDDDLCSPANEDYDPKYLLILRASELFSDRATLESMSEIEARQWVSFGVKQLSGVCEITELTKKHMTVLQSAIALLQAVGTTEKFHILVPTEHCAQNVNALLAFLDRQSGRTFFSTDLLGVISAVCEFGNQVKLQIRSAVIANVTESILATLESQVADLHGDSGNVVDPDSGDVPLSEYQGGLGRSDHGSGDLEEEEFDDDDFEDEPELEPDEEACDDTEIDDDEWEEVDDQEEPLESGQPGKEIHDDDVLDTLNDLLVALKLADPQLATAMAARTMRIVPTSSTTWDTAARCIVSEDPSQLENIMVPLIRAAWDAEAGVDDKLWSPLYTFILTPAVPDSYCPVEEILLKAITTVEGQSGNFDFALFVDLFESEVNSNGWLDEFDREELLQVIAELRQLRAQ
jgi:hypothetical protein